MNDNVSQKTTQGNLIRGKMLMQNISARQWAIANGFPYNLTINVMKGLKGKLQSPVTISGKIQAALKRDGFWPKDEEQP